MARWMKSAGIAVLALGGAACATSEMAALDGDWAGVQVLREGKVDTALTGHLIRFDGNHFAITRDGKVLFGGRYEVDPMASPPEIDFHQTESEDAGRDLARHLCAARESFDDLRQRLRDGETAAEAPQGLRRARLYPVPLYAREISRGKRIWRACVRSVPARSRPTRIPRDGTPHAAHRPDLSAAVLWLRLPGSARHSPVASCRRWRS